MQDDCIRRMFIYALCDPESGEIRYIGQTKNPARRFTLHLSDRHKNYKSHWVRAVLSRGDRPIMRVLEECDFAICSDRERWWIADCRAKGFRLVNATDGGEGISGYRLSPEARKRASDKLRGRPVSEETRRKIGESNRKVLTGRKLSDAHRASMSAYQRGRPHSAEHNAAVSKALKGRPLSEQNKEGLKQAWVGRKARGSGLPSGEQNVHSKLTAANVIEIRAKGMKGSEFARKFGVKQATICDIQKGRTWKHIPVEQEA